jgi:ribosomal protein L1
MTTMKTMKTESTVDCIRKARKAGLDMREVSERLDASVSLPNGLEHWKKWVHSEILLALGH